MQVEEIVPEEMISLRHVPKPEEEKPEAFKRTEVEEVLTATLTDDAILLSSLLYFSLSLFLL